MVSKSGYSGCTKFKSFISSYRMKEYTEEQRLARAKFHERLREVLFRIRAKYFTPSKWKYLDIPREW
jgi:hypothetical protein